MIDVETETELDFRREKALADIWIAIAALNSARESEFPRDYLPLDERHLYRRRIVQFVHEAVDWRRDRQVWRVADQAAYDAEGRNLVRTAKRLRLEQQADALITIIWRI